MHDIISLSISKISVIFQRFVWNEIGFDLFIEKNRGCVCFNIFIQHWNPVRPVNQNRYNYLYKLTLSVALSDAHLTGDHWFDHHQFRNILKCWLIMKYFLLVILSRWFKKDFLSVSAILTANHNNCRLLCHLLVILSHFCKQCGPRSDCSGSSLIRVHTVCLYAKIGLKSLQEYSADDINRQHFQMQVFIWRFKG